MKFISLLYSAVPLSINRFVLQISAIVLLSILGHHNTNTLAAYSLLSSSLMFFIIAATSGQAGLPSEFARLQTNRSTSNMLLASALLFFGALSLMLFLAIWLLGDHLIVGSGAIFDMVRDSLFIAGLEIPFVAVSQVLVMFMEGHEQAKIVSYIKIGQLIYELFWIVIWVTFFQLNLFSVVAIELSTNVIGLILLALVVYRHCFISIGYLKPNITQLVRLIFKIGLPTIFSQLLIAYTSFYLIRIITGCGSDFLVALSTIGAIVVLVQIPITGISQQIGLNIARAHGQQQPIWPALKMGLQLIIFSILLSGTVLFLGRTSAAALLTSSTSVQMIFIQSIGIVAGYCFVSILSSFFGTLLRAIGDYTFFPSIAAICITGFIPYTYFAQQAPSFSNLLTSYCLFVFLADIIGLGRFLWLYHFKIKLQ